MYGYTGCVLATPVHLNESVFVRFIIFPDDLIKNQFFTSSHESHV